MTTRLNRLVIPETTGNFSETALGFRLTEGPISLNAVEVGDDSIISTLSDENEDSNGVDGGKVDIDDSVLKVVIKVRDGMHFISFINLDGCQSWIRECEGGSSRYSACLLVAGYT